MFTSGTQGRPKGVVVAHRALLNYSSWCADTFCRDGSGVPLFSLGFDHSITFLWPVLISGGSIVLVPGIWDLRAVYERRPRRFDFIKATPSHIRFFERLYRPSYGELTGALMFGGESPYVGNVSAIACSQGARSVGHRVSTMWAT